MKRQFRRANHHAPPDHKGAMAYHSGISLDGNPYGGHESRAWIRGWKDAEKRAKKEKKKNEPA